MNVKGVFPQQAFWLEMVSKQVLLNAELLLMLVANSAAIFVTNSACR